jgi:predicted nucleic acid-binding protein
VILVDTNVWSETLKTPANPNVVGWLHHNRELLWLSVIVIAEIRQGVELPKAAAKRPQLEAWLNWLEANNRQRILNFDVECGHIFGALLARRSGDANLLDIQIAAQAMARGATVATRNVKDFAWTGVTVANPWDS